MRAKNGILLVNLGTPDSPSVKDVRKYLAEFLLDPRVMDMPAMWRNLLVRGLIVPFRARRSVALYTQVWDTQYGSPLLHYSRLQQQQLQQELGEAFVVELAMRYGNPSITAALARLRAARVRSIRVIALFPQYASATTGSVNQRVMEQVSHWPVIPEISFANLFYDRDPLVQAFAVKGRSYGPGTYDHILFSFHGLPQRQLVRSDPGRALCLKVSSCCQVLTTENQHCCSAQCYQAASLIAKRLQVPPEKYTVSFQSRLGRAPWLQPYTGDRLRQLAREGRKRVLVFCPSFVSDCLETLQEISVEYRSAFITAGGAELQLVEGLNDSLWLTRALKEVVAG